LKAVMRTRVASVVRRDTEIKDHMNLFYKGGAAMVDRGVVAGGPNGARVYKFGEVQIGGGGGATIELWVNDEFYLDETGAQAFYLPDNAVVFTSAPESIMGYQAFGRILDEDAGYQALPKFPKNYRIQEGDLSVEKINLKSAPLMVPINPNATFKATVLS